MPHSNTKFEALSLRPATPEDRELLRIVFAGTRSDELARLAKNQRDEFIDLQFNLQQQNYLARYPSAENAIILLGEQPIGRMLVARARNSIVLVDIAILEQYRNRGIGSYLIKRLMKEVAGLHKALELSVYRLNPALQLYERLGFSRCGGDDAYVHMKWQPERG